MRRLRPPLALRVALACGGLIGASPGAASTPEELARLDAAVDALRGCQTARLLHGPAIACEDVTAPAPLRSVYDDLARLALGGAGLPQQSPAGPHSLCQLAIVATVAGEVGPEAVARFCDVEHGAGFPVAGTPCARALGPRGARVDAPALGACLAGVSRSWRQRARGADLPRPNIVFVLTDDQRFDTLDATHSSDGTPVMPELSRIARGGVAYTRAYAASSVCAPSRASLLTGQHLFRHGLLRNEEGADFDDSSTLATWLHASGYRTGFFGKYINGYEERFEPDHPRPVVPPGWDVWRAFVAPHDQFRFEVVEDGRRVGYDGPGSYSTDLVANQLLDFVAGSVESGSPFFAYVSTPAPHFPWDPAPRHRGRYAGLAPWRPPSYGNLETADKPLWVRSLRLLTPELGAHIEEERRGQLEMLQAVDELLGRLDRALEDLGVAEDTVLVFTSDNGMAWGEQRYFRPGKLCPGEECVRVPLVIRYPRLAPAGHVEDSLVSHVDLAPLLARLAGARLPAQRDGRPGLWRSLDTTLRAPRGHVLFEVYSRPPIREGIWSWAGVRTPEWKYVEYATRETELYQMHDDPWELQNLARKQGYVRQRIRLRNLLHRVWPGFPKGFGRARAP